MTWSLRRVNGIVLDIRRNRQNWTLKLDRRTWSWRVLTESSSIFEGTGEIESWCWIGVLVDWGEWTESSSLVDRFGNELSKLSGAFRLQLMWASRSSWETSMTLRGVPSGRTWKRDEMIRGPRHRLSSSFVGPHYCYGIFSMLSACRCERLVEFPKCNVHHPVCWWIYGVHRDSQNYGRCHHRVDPDISTGAGCISAFFVVFLRDVLEFLFIVDIPIHDELDASTNTKLLCEWCVHEHRQRQRMEKTIPITWSSKIEANIAEKKDNICKMALGVVHIWRHISLANFRPPCHISSQKQKNPQIWRHKPLILPPPSPQEG